MSSSAGLSALVDAQRNVIAIIKDELRSNRKAKFPHEFFLRYAKEKHAFFMLATRHFQETHRDFRGEELCTPGDISIYFTADARFSPSVLYSESKARICLPVTYCFTLDVFTCCMLQRRSGDIADGIELDIYADILLAGFKQSFVESIRTGARRWLEEPDWNSALTIYTSALSSLAVLYHEIGHFAAGHTSHYHQNSGRGTRGLETVELFHAEDAAATTEAGGLRRVLAELTADTYALVRLYLYAEPYDMKESFGVRTPYTFNRLVAPIQACLIPLYLAESRRTRPASAEEFEAGFSWRSHPPMMLREQNIWNALYFCLFPAAQQWYDVRLTELESTRYVQSLRKAELNGSEAAHAHRGGIDHLFAIAYYKVRMDLCEGMVRSLDDFDRDIAQALFAAKSCCVGFQDPLPDVAQALVSPLAKLIDLLWVSMSSGTNFGFAQSAPYHWFREYSDLRAEELHRPNVNSAGGNWPIVDNSSGLGRIIRDPVFKIIDDWMSTVLRFRMDDDQGARIRATTLHVNAIDVRILGRNSDLFYFAE